MNAKERFEETRRAILRLNDVKLLIMNGCDDWKPPQVKAHHETSDPTAARAVYNVDVLAGKLEALRSEESELEDFIGESLKIIHAVRVGFGDLYADMLEWRYIDGLSFSQIAEEHEMSKSTAHGRIDIACEWVDSVGVSRLLNGHYEI